MNNFTKLLLLSYALVVFPSCNSSHAQLLESEIEHEASTYNRVEMPSDKIASTNRRLELLRKLENLGRREYELFIVNQRLVSYLRLYRWSHELGDTIAADKALVAAQAVNKQFALGAIGGVDLTDERNHLKIRKSIDELDSGYAR
jgi:hypothetical protein